MGRGFVKGLLTAAGFALLVAAVVLHEDATPKLSELEGLRQGGDGLVLPIKAQAWDVSSGPRDERLADQVASWTRSGKGVALRVAPGSDTQQLAQVDSAVGGVATLKKKMRSAQQQLRLSNFLTGVSPAQTEKQVLKMDASMDPKDTTGWREAAQAAGSAKDAAVVGNKKPTKHEQLQEISEYRRMIQKSLSTTKSQDSDRAKQMRSELKQLLARRAALKAAVSREEDRVIKKGGRAWVGHVKPDPAQ
eukprot:CAMPEP_0172018786 /NCGR_PEP_ID=MMETSP1041-20130122/12287_1 /TAXON_ID=464988 /ORGANISM="Hemiselmis andersenii, Strain CCMP439" /LENGTH=247 /DNA_ID=CAMNT_0012673913 /DNA_START=9 /DNA_END=749 /DNA_ORIENTATION=+